MTTMKNNVHHNLQKYFLYDAFRPGQEEIVQAIMDGRDTVALMPTGGGKSLCYQLPAVMRDGVTVVVSPLIALMKNQVDALNARGIAAAAINSSLAHNDVMSLMRDVRQGKIMLLYVAPERLVQAQFIQLLQEIPVVFVAIDEAHCVSQWGHDFRPDYLAIKDVVAQLRPRPVVGAFTATATPEVVRDIVERLTLHKPAIFVRGFDRPNLRFFVQKDLKPKEKLAEMVRVIQSLEGVGIVYALTRKDAEHIAVFLNDNGIVAAAYHAGMNAATREDVQNRFMANEFTVIVATVAFGMGVDKADIRFVMHAGMPKNVEGYYQEAGRAGRDGETAYCVLLHGKKDVATHRFMLRGDRRTMINKGMRTEDVEELMRIKEDRLAHMIDYVTLDQCRRKTILTYFRDPTITHDTEKQSCGGCDVCLAWKKKSSASAVVQKSLGAVDKMASMKLGDTITQTVRLYQQQRTPAQISKIRGLHESTILGHLLSWYVTGGDFDITSCITPQQEKTVLEAMARAEDYQRLGAIKQQLPRDLSYIHIKAVIAKIQRMSLK